MKAPVEEHFEMKNGRASWKNRSEKRRSGNKCEGVLPSDGCAAGIHGVLARALLKAPDQKLALLPAGEASVERGAQS